MKIAIATIAICEILRFIQLEIYIGLIRDFILKIAEKELNIND